MSLLVLTLSTSEGGVKPIKADKTWVEPAQDQLIVGFQDLPGFLGLACPSHWVLPTSVSRPSPSPVGAGRDMGWAPSLFEEPSSGAGEFRVCFLGEKQILLE